MKVKDLIAALKACNPEALVQVTSCCYPAAPPYLDIDTDLVRIDQAEQRSFMGTYED